MTQIVKTTDDALQIYQDRDFGSPVVANLQKDVEIQLGAQSIHEGRQWIEASLTGGGVSGYVLGPSARGHTTLGVNEKPHVILANIEKQQQTESAPSQSASSSGPPSGGSGLTWFDRAAMKVMNIIAFAVIIYLMRSCQQHH
jgi:hypothetical protein